MDEPLAERMRVANEEMQTVLARLDARLTELTLADASETLADASLPSLDTLGDTVTSMTHDPAPFHRPAPGIKGVVKRAADTPLRIVGRQQRAFNRSTVTAVAELTAQVMALRDIAGELSDRLEALERHQTRVAPGR